MITACCFYTSVVALDIGLAVKTLTVTEPFLNCSFVLFFLSNFFNCSKKLSKQQNVALQI